jgi:putative ABC transport system permease protein
VEGRWFDAADAGKPLLSLEEGLAKTLNLKMGDRLTYDIAGSQIEVRVTSMRKVDWDSFRVNFFAVTPQGVLEKFPASYVTSMHLEPQQAVVIDELVKRFPNLLVIDVAAILAQVQRTMDQVIKAVEFVFLFSVVAGVLVLFAAIGSTHDERQFDAAVMRTLGASARQLRSVQAAEFALIGALSGLFAAFGATAIGYFIAERVLNLPYTFDPWVWLVGMLVGLVGVTVAGLIGTASVLRTPPMQVFRATS